jgi:hypothetical protein
MANVNTTRVGKPNSNETAALNSKNVDTVLRESYSLTEVNATTNAMLLIKKRFGTRSEQIRESLSCKIIECRKFHKLFVTSQLSQTDIN